MIAKLTGLVDSIGEDWAVIDVSGVGYLVSCPGRTLQCLVRGEPASLFVETHAREDRIQLFGFGDAPERDWFRLLMTVQGVGAKVALAVLGVLSVDELMRALASGDRSAIARAPGVGTRLATRIVSELKDKAGAFAVDTAMRPVAASSDGMDREMADAVSALVNLGYGPSEAMGAISQVSQRLGPGAGLEELIRGGLGELAPREHAR